MKKWLALLFCIFPLLLTALVKKTQKGEKKGYKPSINDRKSAFYFGGGLRYFHHSGSYFHDMDENDAQVRIVKEDVTSTSPGLGFLLGKSATIYQKSEKLTFGVEPVLSFSTATLGKPKYVATMEVSFYLNARYGAGATLKNDDKRGYGAGIGLVSGMLFQGLNGVGNIPCLLPAAMAEVRLRRKDQLWYLRLHLPLMAIRYDYETNTGKLDGFRISSVGISIMRD